MSDYRSPATTTNHFFVKDDPTAAPISGSTDTDTTSNATNTTPATHSHVATAGHPADGVVISDNSTKHTGQPLDGSRSNQGG